MSMLITQPARAITPTTPTTPTTPIYLPAPRVGVTVRPATLDDLPFIDALQKKHSKQVGYFHRKTIAAGHVLVACSEPRVTERLHEVAGHYRPMV